MKLSEMNTKQLAAALCRLTQPVSRIAKDEEINAALSAMSKQMRENEHMTMAEKAGALLELVPLLLEKHYADAVEIIAAMTGRLASEVETLNGMQMIAELRDSVDAEFVRFFRSSAAMAQTATARRK